MRLGSLFDGSGTAPLAASMCGIDPVWASEIEPYPIAVTKARFPHMLHLGSITEIDGGKVVPVDIICGGSPCQDLSVAGKQAGLHEGTRSHLFFEMTRIITEMREATNGKYPRYIVWENVPGAFSSNNGRDFHAVLQAFAEIADPDVYVPEPENRGGRLVWKYAGEMVGHGWSIAWRTVDAQYWGVPQRRRRIYLVADLGSERAGEVLFERESMPGNPEPGGAQRQATAGDAEGGAGRGCVYALQANAIDRADTAGCNGAGWRADECYTLNTVDRHGVVYPAVARTLTALAIGNGQMQNITMQPIGNTLDCMHDQQAVIYPGVGITSKQNASNPNPGDPAPTLSTDSRNYLVKSATMPRKYIVRRLTPLECCRLQGFPDWWEDGVQGSDSVRYRMWGNGMALPNMLHVMRGIAKEDTHEQIPRKKGVR